MHQVFSDLKSLFPKDTIMVSVDLAGPNEIEKIINNHKSEKYLVLTNKHVWRYSNYFSKRDNNKQKIFVTTLGYEHKKFSESYHEISLPVWYYERICPKQNISIGTPRNYEFSCLNNRASLHRIVLGYSLFTKGLLNDMLFTQRFHPAGEFEQNSLLLLDDNYIKNYFDFSNLEKYKSILPIVVGSESKFLSSNDMLQVTHDGFNDSYCNIVTETECEEWPYENNNNLPAVSEKSYKPFIAKQIPIYLAARGHLKYLKSLGFETMNDLLPYGYDDFNVIEKIKAIVSIVEFGKKRKNFIRDFYNTHTKEIEHNYNLVTSDKVDQLILNQIKEFLYDI
jgi:hypothetical protein